MNFWAFFVFTTNFLKGFKHYRLHKMTLRILSTWNYVNRLPHFSLIFHLHLWKLFLIFFSFTHFKFFCCFFNVYQLFLLFYYQGFSFYFRKNSMFILQFLLIFFGGVQQVLTFKKKKIGRKKFEKNKKQKGIGTSNTN